MLLEGKSPQCLQHNGILVEKYQKLGLIVCSIGAACARQLAAKGVNLALTYSSNRPNIESLVNDLVSMTNGLDPEATIQKIRISIHQVDMSSTEEIAHLFEEVQREHGVTVDILIPNAGYGKRIKDIE